MRMFCSATVLLALACPKPAMAGPMEDASLGGAVFTGPTSGHASSFFVNPAALGLSGPGTHYHFGGSGQLSSLSIDRQNINLDGSQSPGEQATSHTLTPGAIIAWYSSFQDDNARLGVSLFSPTVQRFPAGNTAFGYHSLGGHLVQGMLTLAGSYRIAGRLIVGLGLSLGYSSLRLKFYRDSAPGDTERGVDSDCAGSPCGYENPEAREFYDINVGSQAALASIARKNFSASIGAALRLPNNSWIGLGYVALPGTFGELALSGTATITRSPRDGGMQEQARAEIGFSMAQMVFLGYRRPVLPDFDFIADLRWQDWSRHSQFDIRLFGAELSEDIPEWMPRHRGLHDVWRLSGGLESNDKQRHRYGARIRLESSAAAPGTATPLLIAGPSATLATGAELHISDQWVAGVGYELGWFPKSTVDNSAFDPREAVSCVEADYDVDACAAAREGRTIATAAGSYQNLRHGLVLSLRYDSL